MDLDHRSGLIERAWEMLTADLQNGCSWNLYSTTELAR
jgi:hypothetical protein